MKKTYTIGEIIKLLNVSEQYVGKLVRQGRLVKLGRGIYDGKSVDKFHSERTLRKTGETREVVMDVKNSERKKVYEKSTPYGLYKEYIEPVLNKFTYEVVADLAPETNYDVLRLCEPQPLMYKERIEAFLVCAIVAEEYNTSNPLIYVPELLNALTVESATGKEIPVYSKVMGEQIAFTSERLRNLLYMFDVAPPQYLKALEGTYRVGTLDTTHATKKQVQDIHNLREDYVKNAKQNNISILGTQVINDKKEYDYAIDNGNIFNRKPEDQKRIAQIILGETTLSESRKAIADKVINYYGLDLLTYIAVHAYSCSNNKLVCLVDEGGTGKDFLTDVITYPINKFVKHEPNLSFANAGATSANPARAQRIFDGSRVVVLEEQTLKTLKNLMDVFIKNYVGQDGSNRIGQIAVGANAVPVFCSLILHMNPTEKGYEYLLNSQTNFTRRTDLVDISKGGTKNITRDWELNSPAKNKPRHSSSIIKTMRMNELDYVWGKASTKDKQAFSNYILEQIFDRLDDSYTLEVPTEYKLDNSLYPQKEEQSVEDMFFGGKAPTASKSRFE